MKAIGIDIGTTSVCGILTAEGAVIKSITKNSEAFIKTGRDWEKIQDAEKLLSLAKEITDDLMEEGVGAIGITGQMHGIVYYDGEGKPISPLYTWQDGRGNQPYKEGTYSSFLGIPSGYGAVTDLYNRENGLRLEEAVGYCTIHDLFAMTLSGRKTPVIHTSDAASFGGFDLKTNTFSSPFSAEVTGDFRIIGEYKDVPVAAAIGDNQASVFGALGSEEGILLNIGTGSQISVVSSEIAVGENIETRPYFGGKYLIVGAALCGGRAYALLERFFSDVVYAATGERVNMYEVMDRMELPSRPMEADTRFEGTRKSPDLTGSISGITTANFTPGGMKDAFLQGMIRELSDMYAEMKGKHSFLVGSGNGIRRNPALIRIAEEAFGAKLRVPVHLEEAAFGAALFAMKATGANIDGMIKYM